MPMYTKCPFCNFDGPHGFVARGKYVGLNLYHSTDKGRDCNYIWGDNGKYYRSALEAFKAQCPRSELKSNWAQMRLADMENRPRLKIKYAKLWQAEYA